MNLMAFESLTGPMTGAALALLKMTLVLMAAFGVALVLRRAPAGARHLVWLAALGAMLLVPAVSAWGPIPLRVLPTLATRPASVATTPVVTPPASVETPVESSSSYVTTAPTTPAPSTPGPAARPVSFGLVLVIAWASGAAFLLALLAIGAWSVRRIERRARKLVDPDWQRPLWEIADRLGLEEAPELLQSDDISIPFASGFWHSRIVLPADSETWSAERRSAVLMHELGHVRRRDLIGHTLSRVVCALYWFHPLVWSAAQRLRAESERACDDLALGLGARPSDYAEHLLEIVTGVRDRRTPAIALAMANPNEFEGRMLAILDPRLPRRGLGRAKAAALVASLAAVALVIGAMTPMARTTATAAGTELKEPLKPKTQTTQVTKVEREMKAEHKQEVKRERQATQVQPAEPIAQAEPANDIQQPAAESRADEILALAQEEDSDHGTKKKEDGAQRVAVLAKTLGTDSNVEVRRIAAWGLEKYAHAEAAASALATALEKDTAEEVREMSAWALANSRGNPATLASIKKALTTDKSRDVRRTAVWALGEMGDRSAVPLLVPILADASPDLRELAAWAIGSCEPAKAPVELTRLLSDANSDVRVVTAWALREIGDESTADELEAAFNKEKNPEVQEALIRALGAMGDVSVETLTRLVSSPNPEIRAVAVAALAGGNIGGAWPWPRPEPRPFP
jgi:beta-lactamase regulating signal transducer with metallopeptidase domain/HEAT repeat protein